MSEDRRTRHGPLTAFDQPALFDMTPVERQPVPRLSPQRRRTIRQTEAIGRGRHPLALADVGAYHLRLHPDAAPADPRDAPGRRCGNCLWRQVVSTGSRKNWPKCLYPGTASAAEWEDAPPRVTRGPATDVRAWWPGCTDHDWGEPALSPDAARWPGDEPR